MRGYRQVQCGLRVALWFLGARIVERIFLQVQVE